MVKFTLLGRNVLYINFPFQSAYTSWWSDYARKAWFLWSKINPINHRALNVFEFRSGHLGNKISMCNFLANKPFLAENEGHSGFFLRFKAYRILSRTQEQQKMWSLYLNLIMESVEKAFWQLLQDDDDDGDELLPDW